MYLSDRGSQTICAVSTPHGVGGISVIRVSGNQSETIVRKLARFLPGTLKGYSAYYGTLTDVEQVEEIDEVVITYFEEGRSFTGEQTIEISCHGSPQICQRVLNQLIIAGARAADRGEFTYRAFMNGRVDLVQAESVLALIESESERSAKLALRQLKGQLSKRIEDLENDVTWLMANLEAGIDFSTEGLELVSNVEVNKKLNVIETNLTSLVHSYRAGRAVKDGIRVAFAGRPNVGKSSLLNLFLEDERAIVTDIAGTTRDVISGDTQYSGYRLTFLDTAGIRSHTADLIEQIGIQRSHEAHQEADLLIFVYDLAEGILAEDLNILQRVPKDRLIIIGNKADKVSAGVDKQSELLLGALCSRSEFENLTSQEDFVKRSLFFVSALDQNTRPLVLNEIVSRFTTTDIQGNVLLSSSRHFENLSRALMNIRRSRELINDGMGAEFLAIELKEALISIQETLGKRYDDQVMDRVFKEFCLGK